MAAAAEPEQQEDDEDYGDDDQCPEGVLEVDLSNMTAEQSEPILLAARQAEIGRVGACVPGATALVQRTEMRDDDMNMICTYGHGKIVGKWVIRVESGLLCDLFRESGQLMI